MTTCVSGGARDSGNADRTSETLAATSPAATVTEIADLLRRSGHDMLLAGANLSLVVIGLLVSAQVIWVVSDPIQTGLLAGLIGCLLRGFALLGLAAGHLLHPLARLRRITGAPSKPGWRPVLAEAPDPSRGELLGQVQLMVAAAHDRVNLTQAALRWAFASTGGFAVWIAYVTIAGSS